MAALKLKSSTIMETIVATVITIVIFMVASLTLNNIVTNSFSSDRHTIRTKMSEVKYLIKNNIMVLPARDTVGSWAITAKRLDRNRVIIVAKKGDEKLIDNIYESSH